MDINSFENFSCQENKADDSAMTWFELNWIANWYFNGLGPSSWGWKALLYCECWPHPTSEKVEDSLYWQTK